MHLMHLRCFFGRHGWYEIANAPDGYDARVCARCGKRQWKFEIDHPGLGNSWINGELPKPKPHNPPPPQAPRGGTGVQAAKPITPDMLNAMVIEPIPQHGLTPEEQGKP
jgi:hypothetical protein